jgi:DNA-binding transcriptional LysR family regulator
MPSYHPVVDLDPRRLALLAAVVRAGGVLAAARALHVTPSAISQQLARLEREAGVALLGRGGRRIGVTAAGAALAERGARIEAEVVSAAGDLATLTRRLSGPVTVAAFPTAIAALVAPAVTRLREEHPGVRPRIRQIPEDAALAGLRAGAVDVTVLERDAADLSLAPRGLRDVPLVDDPYLVVLPTEWPDAAGGPTTGVTPAARARAIAGLPWVAGPVGSPTRSVLERLADTTGVPARIEHEALEFPAVLALVAAGLGIALLPRLALPRPDDPLHGRITTLQLPGLGARRLVARHRSSRGEPSPATAAVLEALSSASPP